MMKEGVMISGRYEIIGRIGTGGMADVYKAMDRVLNRYVAVKVLKREFREDEMFVQKFRTEAQSAAGLSHANIVNVYDVGEDNGLYYIVMELVEGITLKDYIKKKGKLNAKETISIAIQVCSGIEAAHNSKIIHRDIKPQNIIISKEGKVKVTDFGIAKATSSNTISTNAMGSVHYTSPEQARGGFSNEKSDIYSLGITMYEMITGKLPFDGDSTVAIALKHLQEDITEPSELVPDIPYSLEQIILKCTQKSQDRRYASVAQLERDLRHSLVDPDGEFVVIAPLTAGTTRMITQDEMDQIQNASYKDSYDEEYDEYDEYEEERSRRRRSKNGSNKENASSNKGINPKMARVMRILTIVVALIFVFILVFFVGKATGIFKIGPGNPIVNPSEKQVVPKLVGKTEEEAESLCEEAGYKLKVVEYALSDKYEEGYVIEQRTEAGTELQEGAFVQVVVSEGLKGKEVPIPDVKNMLESEAKEKLIQAGFSESNIEVLEKSDGKIEIGRVIGTDPEIGKMIITDEKITIFVSRGPEKVLMPKLVGKTKEEAEEALKDVELVGSVKEEYSDKPEGEVISQSIEAGERIDKGETIEYVVSKGEAPVESVTIPTNLVGKSYNEVEAALRNLDLTPKRSFEKSEEYAYGYVTYVEGAGEEVPKGSTVNVVVSTGPGPGTDNSGGALLQ